MIVSTHEKFDVLNSQESLEDGARHVPIKKITDFSQIRKPTDIELDAPDEVTNDKNKIPQITPETAVHEIVETKKESIAPKPLLDYVDKLIIGGRNLKVLKMDIEYSSSTDEIKKFISRELDKGLNKSEVQDLMMFLGIETHEVESTGAESNEVVDRDLASLREDYIKNLSLRMQLIRKNRPPFGKAMEDLGADRHMPLPNETSELAESRELYIKKRNAGIKSEEEGKIIMAGVIENLTELERNLLSKADKIWDSGDPEALYNISYIFMSENGVLKFVKLPQPPAYEGFRKGPDTPAPNVGPEISAVAEAPVAPETPTVSPEIVQSSEQVPKSQELIFPLEFKGKIIQVIRGGGSGDQNSIRVVFDGKEIAKGAVTTNGPKVLLDEKFKGNIFLATTEEKLAFDHATNLIKGFTMNS